MTGPARKSSDLTHTTLSVLVLVVLVVSTLWVLSPFFSAILWATIVSVTTWPLLLRLQALLGGRRGLAVTVMTIATLLVAIIPITAAVRTIVDSAQNVTAEVKHLQEITLPALPGWIADIPFGGKRLVSSWNDFAALGPEARTEALTPYVQSALQWFAAQAGNVGLMLLQFLLTMIISAILLTKGETVRDAILRFATRLAGRQGYDAALLAGMTIRSVVLGVVVTALVQAAIGGAGLFIAGVPAAGLLTAVLLFLCMAQVGPLLVLLPAVVWLYWSGQSAWGTALLVITLITGALDNVLRPLLIKRGADVPLVLIFGGVIGGLLAIGIMGLFIGPVVLTVAFELLERWVADDDAVADATVENEVAGT